MFAAALDPAIDGLYLCGGLASFENLIETEVYRCPFARFVPNLLRHTDLPEVAASITPRAIVLAGTVNAAGETIEPDAVRNIYQVTNRAGNVSVREQRNGQLKR